MKISKDSWHYKMLTEDFWYVEGKHPYDISDSLCGYFWQVVFRAIFFIIFLLIAPIAVTGMGVVAPFVQIVGFLTTGYWDTNGMGSAVLIAEIILVATGGLIWSFFWVKEKLEDVKRPKSVNIFTEYVKAKHDKVCPMLEFTDD